MSEGEKMATVNMEDAEAHLAVPHPQPSPILRPIDASPQFSRESIKLRA